jgi:hypothetical protein
MFIILQITTLAGIEAQSDLVANWISNMKSDQAFYPSIKESKFKIIMKTFSRESTEFS